MIKIENLSKKFKNVEVIKNISFEIASGEIVALIGPSGCGKTTTLKMINRLIAPSSGNIYINGKSIYETDIIKLRRSIGYVIQQTGLFPHMTAKENIELIPKTEKHSMEDIEKRTLELMEMIGMDKEFLKRYPNELSGGQQQRIGVARAFATNPDIILMDEPFSALDPISRNQLQDELLNLQDEFHKTIVFVTHDMDEAIKLADRICIMNEGHILQYDTSEMILRHPKKDFVEDFVGKNRIWQSPEFICAEDVMIDNPVSCSPSTTITKAIEKMKNKRVDSLMVVDKNGKFLGVIKADNIRLLTDRSQFVKTYIDTDFDFCRPNECLVDVLTILSEKKLSNVPVLNENGQLHGLVTKGSLVLALSQPIMDTTMEEQVSSL